VIFVGHNFVLGLLGSPTLYHIEPIEEICRQSSSKEVKVSKRTEVKFDFKEKGKKPVTTKDCLLFSITGQDFNVDKIYTLFKETNLPEIE
jgi:hypothetical protein